MGGAAGHIQHLYENRDLKFSELKAILKAAARGRLDHVTEKLDGQALTFTWDDDYGGVLVARSAGDVARGGLTVVDLAEKFKDKPWVAHTFVSAFKVLESATSALSDGIRSRIFKGGRYWYSAEVIYTQNPNVINYDQNSIVFHGDPVFERTVKGVKKIDGDDGSQVLARNIDRMQSAVAARGWRLQEPVLLRLQGLSDGSILNSTLNRIEDLQHIGRVKDGDTINDYLENLVKEEVANLGLANELARSVTARVLELPDCPTLTQLKKQAPPQQVDTISRFIHASEALLKKMIRPLELIIHDFAVELLKGVHSTLVRNNAVAVRDLRTRLQKAISEIEASKDVKAIDILHQNLWKMGGVQDVNTAVEGIVFIYKGEAYKFTGNFAPLNQILGLFRYARGEVAERTDEAYLRSVIQGLLQKAPSL